MSWRGDLKLEVLQLGHQRHRSDELHAAQRLQGLHQRRFTKPSCLAVILNPMRTTLVLALALAVQGCATTASDPSKSHTPVPAVRVLALPAAENPSQAPIVHVMRDAQFKGAAMTTTLTFDGQEIAHIESGESLTFKVEPGEHLLGLKFLGNDPVLGILTLGIARPKRFIESATRFEPGRDYFFRIVDNANWEWDLKRSSY
jgi:hypothetical protein